jgi:hypothetical protein
MMSLGRSKVSCSQQALTNFKFRLGLFTYKLRGTSLIGHLPSGSPIDCSIHRELGGSMCPIWPDYFGECRGVVFVVDVSDNADLAPATVELYELLQHEQLKV